MKYPDIDGFDSDASYFEEIYPNVWLMDDHRWAYFVWEQCLNRVVVKMPRTLIHIDYHWDGINDFKADSSQELLCGITEIEDIYIRVKERKMVQYDSFIAPSIIRGIINEIHFLCFENDNLNYPGLDDELLNRFNARQFIHSDLHSMLRHAPKGSLLDIDLDVFNKSDYWATGELWTDIEILELIDGCSELIKCSPLITIAMSFNYSGTNDDTKHLTRLVVPKVIDILQS